MVIIAGILVVNRYVFSMTTEKDLHEKRTVKIGTSVKAPPEAIIIASTSALFQEVFDKVAEINRLNRKLHGQPELPSEMLRPKSIEMKGVNDIPVEMRAHELDNSLDQELKRLRMLTGDVGEVS